MHQRIQRHCREILYRRTVRARIYEMYPRLESFYFEENDDDQHH